ncbi:hypothetical protein IHE26_06695 [Plesiomonas shigelloides]|uniref:hypothetical protein n=1 Tax=Plesiomonas shigelloides TaxID=703 RepID=UPI001785DCBF|nr:hypothetical protein [Plesiomonas shigelloides]QOH80947.1 hypothetical protein IHE26_06695 [Plesiomonas shigelloides]
MNKTAWPIKYEKLFTSTGNYYEFAHIAWGGFEIQTAGYCLGYKKSADTLINDAISSKDIEKLDTFVFPAIFLYRQYIELTLKSLILTFSELDSDAKINKFKTYNHNLHNLWVDFKSIYSKTTNIPNDTAVNIVEKYITDLHELDKTSFSFRYPFTKELELIFPKEKRINLKHLKDRMNEIESFFNGTSDYMYEINRTQK